jgi:plasmid stabilization system protein ParE
MVAGRRRVAWSPTALRQLEDALEYLSERSPSAASRLLDDAFAAGDSLETMGERGREVPEIRDGRTRELLVQRYRLMYEVSIISIDIVAFVHTARDFDRQRRRR